MPIIFISLDNEFIRLVKERGYEGTEMLIEEYVPVRKTYYISPANSLCFMDGGIDYPLSRIIFPGVEADLKKKMHTLEYYSLLGRPYLPIGSSIIIDRADSIHSLVASPTMFLPQNVRGTRNAYFCTMSVLFNILVNRGEKLEDVDIIFTSFCCGYGKMTPSESLDQIIQGIEDYPSYNPHIFDDTTVIKEPNLSEQPKYYMNKEWLQFDISEMIRL